MSSPLRSTIESTQDAQKDLDVDTVTDSYNDIHQHRDPALTPLAVRSTAVEAPPPAQLRLRLRKPSRDCNIIKRSSRLMSGEDAIDQRGPTNKPIGRLKIRNLPLHEAYREDPPTPPSSDGAPEVNSHEEVDDIDGHGNEGDLQTMGRAEEGVTPSTKKASESLQDEQISFCDARKLQKLMARRTYICEL